MSYMSTQLKEELWALSLSISPAPWPIHLAWEAVTRIESLENKLAEAERLLRLWYEGRPEDLDGYRKGALKDFMSREEG